ncbi:hypothetical protein BH10PSE4_BH10PSE4_32110 [soil metagenome]
MKRFVGAMAAVLCLMSGVAHADPTAPTAVSNPRVRALAEQYFEVIHYDQMLAQMMKGMGPAMADAMRKSTPELTAEQSQAISEVAIEASQKMVTRMKAPMIDAMSEIFTERELTDLVAFYGTPSGQALIAKSPELSQRLMAQMPAMMGEMQAEMRKSLCEKIDCQALAKK